MIEGLIVRALERFLVAFLEDFDKNILNISFLKGKIKLQNLKLNNKILEN
jgi:hypothetical protein